MVTLSVVNGRNYKRKVHPFLLRLNVPMLLDRVNVGRTLYAEKRCGCQQEASDMVTPSKRGQKSS